MEHGLTPAFPTARGPGMDLRDYFAAAALIGLVGVARNYDEQSVYDTAYEMADRMLIAREKSK